VAFVAVRSRAPFSEHWQDVFLVEQFPKLGHGLHHELPVGGRNIVLYAKFDVTTIAFNGRWRALSEFFG